MTPQKIGQPTTPQKNSNGQDKQISPEPSPVATKIPPSTDVQPPYTYQTFTGGHSSVPGYPSFPSTLAPPPTVTAPPPHITGPPPGPPPHISGPPPSVFPYVNHPPPFPPVVTTPAPPFFPATAPPPTQPHRPFFPPPT